jgi:hypothetical protein
LFVKSDCRECLFCGLLDTKATGDIADRHLEPLCVKCDNPLWSQSDGSIVTADIAHQHETVPQALLKFRDSLNRSWQQGHAGHLRLIVGGGLIRDAVLGELYFLRSKGTILDYHEENRGAVLIRIREPLW